MKSVRHILTVLFSAYLLGLMVLPCSESHALESRYHMAQSSQQQDSDHEHSMEICTPFCVCAGCVAAIVLQAPIDFKITQPEIPLGNVISNFYQSIKSDFHGSIWQPPQLV